MKKHILSIVTLSLLLGVSSCRENTNSETVDGESIQLTDDNGDLEKAAEDTKEALKDAGNAVEDAAKDVKDAVNGDDN